MFSGLLPNRSSSDSAADSSVFWRPSSSPKTVRMMISSVSACMRGRVASGSPTGHVAISRSATSFIVSA